MTIFCRRRASARSFSICLNSSNVVDPMTRRSPAVRIGLIIVARSIVPPAVAPAPTVEWISSMNRIARGRAASARMTALKRSSKSPRNRVPASSALVSSENTSAPSRISGTSSCSSRDGQPFGHGRLADAGLADEHRVVLATPAEHFDRPLQLGRAADQRIEQALRARDRSGSRSRPPADRATRPGPPRRCRPARRRPIPVTRSVEPSRDDAVRNELEDVEPRDALALEQARGL